MREDISDDLKRARAETHDMSLPGSRNHFYYKRCPECKEPTPHLTYLGNKCSICQEKKLLENTSVN